MAQLNAKLGIFVSTARRISCHPPPPLSGNAVEWRPAALCRHWPCRLERHPESFSTIPIWKKPTHSPTPPATGSPGYFICSGGEIEPGGDYAFSHGSAAVGRLSGDAVFEPAKDGETGNLYSFSVRQRWNQGATKETGIPPLPTPLSSDRDHPARR